MDDVYAPARAQVRPTATHVALFLATIATTLWMGFWFSPLAPLGPTLGRVVEGGAPFAASLVAILFSHEMGHYVLARRHRVDTTLPYFIPVPFGAGTLGAVIRIRSPIPTRRAALEIGAAGPWAGFVVAVPLLLWGLAHSEVRIEAATAAAAHAFARSPWDVFQAFLAGRPAFGVDPGVPLFGDSLVTWAAQRLVLGPLPETAAVLVHPVALAAWIGLLVTTLNLVPFGQLDGGHVLYALLGGRRARRACEVVSFGLLAAGLFVSWSWLFWWLLTRVLVGPRHPPALREEPLTRGRVTFALASLVLFLVTFVPVPVSF
jgi:membrane-associated protease RseP (regulator of RpoE activity)